MNKKALQTMARLRTQLAIKDAQIQANPRPYLEAASDAMVEVHRCFDELERVLSPDFDYGLAQDMNIPVNLVKADHAKVQAALEVLRKYYAGEYKVDRG